jgi:hypothetical protein
MFRMPKNSKIEIVAPEEEERVKSLLVKTNKIIRYIVIHRAYIIFDVRKRIGENLVLFYDADFSRKSIDFHCIQ